MHARQNILVWLGSILLGCAGTAGTAQSAVIFMYHHIADDKPAATSISPTRFHAQMDYLEREGFSVLPLMQVVTELRAGRALPPRSVVLTFDDGYHSVLTQALPTLKDRGWPFTVFVTTGYVDGGYGDYLDWDDLREIAEGGGTIGNHTVSHAHLTQQLLGESHSQWMRRMRKEIVAASKRISEELPKAAIPAMAYPYGEYDAAVVALVAELDLVGLSQQSGALGPVTDWLVVPRFAVATGYDELEDFALRAQTMPLELTVDDPYQTLNSAPDGMPVFHASLPHDLARADELACYASGLGRIRADWEQSPHRHILVQPTSRLRPGRTKVNCTVPHASLPGVFLWHSKLWLTRNADGSWYSD